MAVWACARRWHVSLMDGACGLSWDGPFCTWFMHCLPRLIYSNTVESRRYYCRPLVLEPGPMPLRTDAGFFKSIVAWWRRRFLEQAGENPWAPAAREPVYIIRFVFTSTLHISSQHACQDNKINSHPLYRWGLFFSPLHLAVVTILSVLMTSAEGGRQMCGQSFGTRGQRQTLRFYYQLL